MKIIVMVSGWRELDGFLFTEQVDELDICDFSFGDYLTRLYKLADSTELRSDEDLLFGLSIEKNGKTTSICRLWLSELRSI